MNGSRPPAFSRQSKPHARRRSARAVLRGMPPGRAEFTCAFSGRATVLIAPSAAKRMGEFRKPGKRHSVIYDLKMGRPALAWQPSGPASVARKVAATGGTNASSGDSVPLLELDHLPL